MRAVEITYTSGEKIETSINGTDEEIARYYVGQVFNLGDGKGGDRMETALSVRFLPQPPTLIQLARKALETQLRAWDACRELEIGANIDLDGEIKDFAAGGGDADDVTDDDARRLLEFLDITPS